MSMNDRRRCPSGRHRDWRAIGPAALQLSHSFMDTDEDEAGLYNHQANRFKTNASSGRNEMLAMV